MLYNGIRSMSLYEVKLVRELNRFRQNKDAIFSSIKSLTDMDCTGILMSVSNLSKDALKDLNVLMDMQTCFSQGDVGGKPIIGVLPREVGDVLSDDFYISRINAYDVVFKDSSFKMTNLSHLIAESFVLIYMEYGVVIYHKNCQAIILYSDCINLKPFLMMVNKYGSVFTKVLDYNKTLAQYVYSDEHNIDTIDSSDNLYDADIINILMFKNIVFKYNSSVFNDILINYRPCESWLTLRYSIDAKAVFYGHRTTMLFKDLPELVASAYINDSIGSGIEDKDRDSACETAIASLIRAVPDYIANSPKMFRKPMEVKIGNRHIGYADGNLSKERAIRKCLDAMNRLNVSLYNIKVETNGVFRW